MSGAALPDRAARLAVWRAHGAGPAEAEELLVYASHPLHEAGAARPGASGGEPPFVADWVRYEEEALRAGAWPVLRRVLLQLRFPIADGLSRDPSYLAATRRGREPGAEVVGLELVRPEGLRVRLHPTPAGRLPVLLAEERQDFEALVQALAHRNEPVPVPASMGACTVAGYNNWERVGRLRQAWADQHPEDWEGRGWPAALRELAPRTELYQDCFMIASSGPYSATPAAALGLSEAEWLAASIRLRVEHESTHYFMRQALGRMQKSLLDELVADYMGLVEARGSFKARSFLHFMGLESWPPYRQGGRLQNYRGAPPLSEVGFAVLQALVKRAAENLEGCDPSRRLGPFDPAAKARVITALTSVGLEGLASDAASGLLAGALA